jgi:hypothetical protein
MPFLFSLSTWFSYYPIKNHPPKEKTKKNWAKCSAGLNKTTRFANQPAVTRPGKIQLSVILCGIAYPFLLYVKFTLLRGACITTICLTTQSLQPADKKITTKKEALALTESKQSRSLCWWLWQVHSLAEEWGEDQNLASSSKNCSRSDFFPSTPRLTC